MNRSLTLDGDITVLPGLRGTNSHTGVSTFQKPDELKTEQEKRRVRYGAA